MRACRHCGTEFEGRGWFCSSICRKRAYRRRRAGLSENAYPEGALRGRVPLDGLTLDEQLERAIETASERGPLRW